MKFDSNYRQSLSALVGGKSVPKPIAQSNRLCRVAAATACGQSDVVVLLDAVGKVDKMVAIVLSLQLDYGLRISEILRLSPSNISSTGRLRIDGLKGSRGTFVVPRLGVDYFIKCRHVGLYPFAALNRFYVYRVYKNCGLSHIFEGNRNRSVTHLPRHWLALDACEVDVDGTLVTSVLRHKSPKNDSYYVKKK